MTLVFSISAWSAVTCSNVDLLTSAKKRGLQLQNQNHNYYFAYELLADVLTLATGGGDFDKRQIDPTILTAGNSLSEDLSQIYTAARDKKLICYQTAESFGFDQLNEFYLKGGEELNKCNDNLVKQKKFKKKMKDRVVDKKIKNKLEGKKGGKFSIERDKKICQSNVFSMSKRNSMGIPNRGLRDYIFANIDTPQFTVQKIMQYIWQQYCLKNAVTYKLQKLNIKKNENPEISDISIQLLQSYPVVVELCQEQSSPGDGMKMICSNQKDVGIIVGSRKEFDDCEYAYRARSANEFTWLKAEELERRLKTIYSVSIKK